MSQTESTAEAIVDLVIAKPKRKPRTPSKQPSTSVLDALPERADASLTAVPKVRRARRNKADAVSESSPTPASEPAPQFALKSASEFSPECASELVLDQVSEPVSHPVSDPISEPASEPASEPILEPVSGPVSKPVSALSPAPISTEGDCPQISQVAETQAPSVIAALNLQEVAVPITGSARLVHLPVTPPLHPDVVTLARAVRGGRTTLLPALGADASFSMRLITDTAIPADPYCALVLHSPGGPIELGDGVRLLAALTGIDLGHSAVELPNTQRLHSAVIGRLGQTPLREATSIIRGCLPPDRTDDTDSDAHNDADNNADSDADSDAHNDADSDAHNDVDSDADTQININAATSMQTMRLTLRSTQHAFSMQARASAATWLDLLTRARWQQEQLPLNIFDALPVHLPVLIATHALPLVMLADIAAGDVLLPDTAAFDCTGNGRLCWRGMQITVAYTASAALTILSLESNMEPHDDATDGATDTTTDDVMFHALPLHPPALADEVLAGLPVQLRFEMGRCHTTLDCLRTLAAGTILPIEGGSPSAIAVVANGRQLGRGELVEVNGQLGIRIVHWFA